jgi:hypothetical protein
MIEKAAWTARTGRRRASRATMIAVRYVVVWFCGLWLLVR